jgi:hypothetical protein
MLILEKFRNKYHQIWITVDGENVIQNLVDGEKCDTKFDWRLKGAKQTVLSNRPGPTPTLAMGVC